METKQKASKIPNSLKDTNQWMRLLYMLLFAVIFYVVTGVLFLIAVVQAIFALLTGEANENITKFGGDVSRYIYQITAFLTYHSEEKPFPFAPWPEESEVDANKVERTTVEPADEMNEPGY